MQKKDVSGKIEEKQIMKFENEKRKDKLFIKKKSYIPFLKIRKIILPLRQNMINIVIKFQFLKL